jgi:hypothetical protein
VPIFQGGPVIPGATDGRWGRPCLGGCHVQMAATSRWLPCRPAPVLGVCADTAAVCRPQAETEAELAGADAAERDADAGDPGLDPADYEEVLVQAQATLPLQERLSLAAATALIQPGLAHHLRPQTRSSMPESAQPLTLQLWMALQLRMASSVRSCSGLIE